MNAWILQAPRSLTLLNYRGKKLKKREKYESAIDFGS